MVLTLGVPSICTHAGRFQSACLPAMIFYHAPRYAAGFDPQARGVR
jgi:hypothetical protein